MTLLLITPEQHDFQDPTLELNEKKLQKWLTGLPVLNAGESLRMVLNALEPLNEQKMDVDKRLALLAVYQATVKRLYVAAEPVRLRQQPLSADQRQTTVDDVERLSLAMANGYKIVVKQMYSQAALQDKARFGRVLRWTIQLLAAALLHSYRYYRPEPAFVFLEINQIYRLARHHGLQESVVKDEGGDAEVSLAGIYQAVCLLSLCDPFSLEEGLADSYYQMLLEYTGGARIIPGNSWQGVPEGLFYIDLASDSRPRHCVYLESPVEGDEPHILDARELLKQMHKTLAALSADRRRKRPEAGVLKALLPEITPRDKRGSERLPDGRWIKMFSGFDEVVSGLQARQRGDRLNAVDWRVKDASEGGYCLAWDDSAASLLHVGELVCVISDSDREDAGPAQLMVVRWTRDGRDEGTELGVELLEGVPGPVELEVADEPECEKQPGLFLTSANNQTSARLVTPLEVYAEDRLLTVYVGEREVMVRCAALLEQAPGFDCFEFTSGG
jgi:hypothetical protein